MDQTELLNCIAFFNELRVVETDVTTEEEKANNQKVVVVTYTFKGKSFETNKLYYMDIMHQDGIRNPENIVNYFGKPVFWLDNEVHKWQKGRFEAELDVTVIKEIAKEGDQEFIDFLKKISNNNKNGYLQKITVEGKSPQYGYNLDNNNHWHDLILLVQEIIKNKGNTVDRIFFSRLIFEWQDGYRASLAKEIENKARGFIDILYTNIKSIQKTVNQMEILNLLKSKGQIILQGPPGTGKTRMAEILANELVKTTEINNPLDLIVDFFKTDFSNDKLVLEKRIANTSLINEFQTLFPVDDLKNLTLERYCVGNGDRNNFCWWIETGLRPFGRYFPGSARSYQIYWSKKDIEYLRFGKLKKEFESAEEAIDQLAYVVYELVKNKDTKLALQYLGKSLCLKILQSYYPDVYFPINTESYLDNALKILGGFNASLDAFEKSKLLNDIFNEKKSKFKSDVSSVEFMMFLFNNFNLGSTANYESKDTPLKQGDVKIIQFHPAFSYEDFVRGIVAETTDSGSVNYEVENKILANFALNAINNPSGNYVLVIDEINRANLPAVLGELIYALEYRTKSVESMYATNDEGNTLVLPKNLYIIGTMNTSDRSVGHIDYAIRRRFAFVDVLPEVLPMPNFQRDYFKKVSELFIENFDAYVQDNSIALKASKKYLSEEFKPETVWLGHSYFIKQDGFDFALRVKYEIKPILKEYVKDGILKETALEYIDNL